MPTRAKLVQERERERGARTRLRLPKSAARICKCATRAELPSLCSRRFERTDEWEASICVPFAAEASLSRQRR